jgi:hypothetical protein
MKYIRGFVLFWYDFIVGDDWRVAAGIILAFAGTAGLAALDVAAWWLMPVAALALLSASLWLATRRMQ